jgi:hypothetical protein
MVSVIYYVRTLPMLFGIDILLFFPQDAIMSFDHDWMGMLTSDLGLSQQAFLILLANRHEMQPTAVLDDAEKKYVDALRSVLDL